MNQKNVMSNNDNTRRTSMILMVFTTFFFSCCSLTVFAEEVTPKKNFASEDAQEYQVVIYGGSSGGVAAALQASRLGLRVVLIEASQHLGGLSSGGLGATDSGDQRVIGGIAREFYCRIGKHYARGNAWVRHSREQFYEYYRPDADSGMFMLFEPHVAEQVFRSMLQEANVAVVYGERLDLKNGVLKEGQRIIGIVMESGQEFSGRIFIDTTYEGDLMAMAGVSYVVGREGNDRYGEKLNGVSTRYARGHQFTVSVDPYVTPGDPESGLLPGIHNEGPGEEESGDHRVQAYCFRMCLTDDPANRREWEKPDDYDPARYELLLRYFEAGSRRVPWLPTSMPNRKTDTNNSDGFSTDNIGMNYGYPDGDYDLREQIIAEHLSYQMGLMWTLANSPRVPKEVQQTIQNWGLAKDEFMETNNWPHQLYIREARRMVGVHVMTDLDVRRIRPISDSIGMGSYNMDSHNVQRYVDAEGHACNEGNIEISPGGPYAISYQSICPQKNECTNLLVPVCLSSSHIAYGSIRMEPVFMVLGQSAAFAANLAIAADVPVQEVEYRILRAQLVEAEQVLETLPQ